MVYKIIGNFDDTFGTKLEKLSKKCICIYRNEALFVAPKDVQDVNNIEDFFKKIFKPQKNYFITKIDQNNIMREEQVVRQWCLDSFVRLETQLYEINEQAKLKQLWADMDVMEEKLQKKLEEQQSQNLTQTAQE